jgi:hypothetical protein
MWLRVEKQFASQFRFISFNCLGLILGSSITFAPASSSDMSAEMASSA